jgi:hypothetical protein
MFHSRSQQLVSNGLPIVAAPDALPVAVVPFCEVLKAA